MIVIVLGVELFLLLVDFINFDEERVCFEKEFEKFDKEVECV